ncbi:MAG: thiosulfate oxidation carrier complex protein SoxZ [Acidiferrobacterales bacterium]|nr:thiosulfate oxidation carrier complex protein SoxZ [Acidiferrobacterales bacterium]
MKSKVKLTSEGSVHVKLLIKHPMETGQRKDRKTGEPIPAHFVEVVTCEWQGKEMIRAHWGPAISKNPYLSFKIMGPQAGDMLTLRWLDNQGESGEQQAQVS